MDSNSSKKNGGRPPKEAGEAKTRKLTMRFTDAKYKQLETLAKSFTKSKYYMALYIYSKLFDNGLQQTPGDQLITSINSIVETIDNTNRILSNIAIQIEHGVINNDVSVVTLDNLKESLKFHNDQVRKLQKTLSGILRAATIERK